MEGITTSVLGKGRNIAQAVTLAAHMNVSVVEIAIGPRPIPDFMSWWVSRGHLSGLVTFTGHDAMPIGDGTHMRPEAGLEPIAQRLQAMGVKSYSMHPPDKKALPTLDNLKEWYFNARQMFERYGIHFAVETMYYSPTRKHNLVTYRDVADFAGWAISTGLTEPMVLDLAHVNINIANSQWPETSDNLLVVGSTLGNAWHEIHVSSNDGQRDQHRVYDPQRDTKIASRLARLPASIPRISEGRRL